MEECRGYERNKTAMVIGVMEEDLGRCSLCTWSVGFELTGARGSRNSSSATPARPAGDTFRKSHREIQWLLDKEQETRGMARRGVGFLKR